MRVLIIGSLGGELGRAARMATERGARVDQVASVGRALEKLRMEAWHDLVLCDVSYDIAALIRSIRSERLTIAVVACGIDADGDSAAEAIRCGAQEFLPLPPDPDLIAAILMAAAGEPHAAIVRDPLMLATIRRAEQVAGSEASILITGESGTGKEVLARLIHRKSRRANGPFIALNCAAIPENLLESELFGHEKGAFSGAVARRVGKFEAAECGTLLLDEISEMDIRLQAKLLRAIQEREIDRLGGSGPVAVNVRLLATSNRNLLAETKAGRFREDLFFRLNVVGLLVPPLRDRPGDVPALADHYVRHYAAVNGLPYRPLTGAAMARLTAAAWRGNVRELEHLIERSILMTTGNMLKDVPVPLRDKEQSAVLSTEQTVRTLDENERDHILKTIKRCKGRIAGAGGAASLLGVPPSTLNSKILKLGITKEEMFQK